MGMKYMLLGVWVYLLKVFLELLARPYHCNDLGVSTLETSTIIM